jgi:carbon-monoxide dehydrogenase catalytic subunit
LAGNFASQELAILTGALDTMVVDYQCIIPSIAKVAECFHTKIITTLPMGRLPDSAAVTHIEFDMNDPNSQAIQVVRDSIEAFKQRNPKKVSIPKGPQEAIVGFSTESIISVLAKINQENPLQPLIANIAEGNIQGIALLAGCNNSLVRQDYNINTIAAGLIKENVLILATGCCGGALAKSGLMSPKAAEEYAGPGLKKVLGAIGEAAGLEGPLPPVLHLGSCVNNSRAIDIAVAVANALSVDLDALPVVASAPELMSEKAVSIGTFAVTLGFPVHLGVIPPVTGAQEVVSLLTEEVKNLVGGYFIIEPNPIVAVERLLEVIREKRAALGI